MRCLGLDVGSSSIKGAVLDLDSGEPTHVVREPFPEPILGRGAGHFEIAPAEIASRVKRVLSALCKQSPDASALFLCGQMGGAALVDSAGRPLTNYLSWRDQRTQVADADGSTSFERLKQRWSGNQLRELGGELQAGSTTSLLFWLAERGELPAGALPCTAADLAIAQLAGVAPPMERTQAIGLVNLFHDAWHHAALAELGLDCLHWPQLVEVAEPYAQIVVDGHRLDCYAALGDQQAALFGAGVEEGDLSINASTGSQVSEVTPEPRLGNYQTRYYLFGQYLNTITHLPAGRSLNVLVDLLSELARAEGITLAHPWETLTRAAELATGGGLTCDLTFFAGPLGSEGRIDHITTENLTAGNLLRSALMGMTENYWQCAARLDPDRAWTSLVISGGLTQSIPLLRKLIEERFAIKARSGTQHEETLTGLARVAQTVLTAGT